MSKSPDKWDKLEHHGMRWKHKFQQAKVARGSVCKRVDSRKHGVRAWTCSCGRFPSHTQDRVPKPSSEHNSVSAQGGAFEPCNTSVGFTLEPGGGRYTQHDFSFVI